MNASKIKKQVKQCYKACNSAFAFKHPLDVSKCTVLSITRPLGYTIAKAFA